MSFKILPIEIKAKILEMLSIGDGFNASLVWEEMAEEIRRHIHEDGELIKQWKPRFEFEDGQNYGHRSVKCTNKHCQMFGYKNQWI